MTQSSTEPTRLKYGHHRLVILPNRFDDGDLQAAMDVLGETRMAELTAKAETRNWSEKRLEAEIRCVADEVASHTTPIE